MIELDLANNSSLRLLPLAQSVTSSLSMMSPCVYPLPVTCFRGPSRSMAGSKLKYVFFKLRLLVIGC